MLWKWTEASSSDAEILFQNNSILIINGGKIELAIDPVLRFDNSNLTMTDGNIYMKGGALIEFNNGSLFTTLGEDNHIIGGRASLGDPTQLNNPDIYHDARIVFDSSFIQWCEGTFVSSGSGEYWSGLYFDNVRNGSIRNVLSGTIEGIKEISITESTLDIDKALISGIYFYRIVTDENRAVQRMVLLK